jgi:hypothetical protein
VRVSEQVVQRGVDRVGLFNIVVPVGPALCNASDVVALEPEERVELPIRKEGSICRSTQALANHIEVTQLVAHVQTVDRRLIGIMAAIRTSGRSDKP